MDNRKEFLLHREQRQKEKDFNFIVLNQDTKKLIVINFSACVLLLLVVLSSAAGAVTQSSGERLSHTSCGAITGLARGPVLLCSTLLSIII